MEPITIMEANEQKWKTLEPTESKVRPQTYRSRALGHLSVVLLQVRVLQRLGNAAHKKGMRRTADLEPEPK